MGSSDDADETGAEDQGDTESLFGIIRTDLGMAEGKTRFPRKETIAAEDIFHDLGAFGFPAPYGHRFRGATRISFNMDIVGGATASLCEAYRHVGPGAKHKEDLV